mmetsp:Transcript_5342/g.12129  ORF Transcript_5342/g.12129 Transcript_5342/m.12129 type:complete len:86 (+) Transcript_5342:1378-1635(+)
MHYFYIPSNALTLEFDLPRLGTVASEAPTPPFAIADQDRPAGGDRPEETLWIGPNATGAGSSAGRRGGRGTRPTSDHEPPEAGSS